MWALFFATVVLGAGLSSVTDLRPTADWEIRDARGRAHAYAINLAELHRWTVEYVQDGGGGAPAETGNDRVVAIDWANVLTYLEGSYAGFGYAADCDPACLRPVQLGSLSAAGGADVARLRFLEDDFSLVLLDPDTGAPSGTVVNLGHRAYVVSFIQPGLDVPMMSVIEQVRYTLGRGGEFGQVREVSGGGWEFVPFSGNRLRWSNIDLNIGGTAGGNRDGAATLVAMTLIP